VCIVSPRISANMASRERKTLELEVFQGLENLCLIGTGKFDNLQKGTLGGRASKRGSVVKGITLPDRKNIVSRPCDVT
jgi:hypothetical protein